MSSKNKRSRKSLLFFWNLFNIIIVFILVIQSDSQPNTILFNSSYYLLGQADRIFIPVSSAQFNLSNNGTLKLLKIQAKIQLLDSNGTYMDSPFETGNILVKYWKNNDNTPATSIMGYSYEKLSATKQFPTAIDPSDNGLIDIESVYNYKNEHNFLHVVGNETSDILFVLCVYRFSNYGISDIFKMSKKSDEIRIIITVTKASKSENRCNQCSSKSFCPTNECLCLQQIYSGCNVTKKRITPNLDKSTKANDLGSISKGSIHHMSIEPSIMSSEWFPVQLYLTFQNGNGSVNEIPKKESIFLLLFVQYKNQTTEMIPNLYNFDFIDSPSFISKIVSDTPSSSSENNDSNTPVIIIKNELKNVRGENQISLTQTFLISKNQVITAAIYYLNDTDIATNQNNNELTFSLNMDFSKKNESAGGENMLNLALLIGMIALGFFILILIICFLHYLVSRRFRIFGIFDSSSNSNRNSAYSVRHSREGSILERELILPSVSFSFLNDIVFKPLKYLYSSTIQQNNSKIAQLQHNKKSEHDQVCSICLQQFNSSSMVKYTYCGHILDSKCLDLWLQKQMSCPLCRQKLQPKDITQYENKILQEIVQNAFYQSIIQQQAQTLKKLYKNWKNTHKQSNPIIQNTQQSLVNNYQNNQAKLQQNFFIPNISTMIDFEKTEQNLKQSISKKNQQNPSLLLIKSQNSFNQHLDLKQVFLHNQIFSAKRISKNYLFYRCIFLYHQINKKFDKDSGLNFYQHDLEVERHESVICFTQKQNEEQKRNLQKLNKNLQFLMETQKLQIKPNQQQEQQYIEINLNSDQKINRNSQSESKTEKKKHLSDNQLYFDFQQCQNNDKKSQRNQSNSPSRTSQQRSNQLSNSQEVKIKKRKNKRISMRQQMNQLQRQLQKSSAKQSSVKEAYKFNDKASIILIQESDQENFRYPGVQISVTSGEKSDDQKCVLNPNQVLLISQFENQSYQEIQRMKTLPHSNSKNGAPRESQRKSSFEQQRYVPKQRFVKKKVDLQQI